MVKLATGSKLWSQGLEASSGWASAGMAWQRQWWGSITSRSGLAGSGPAFFACRDAPLWWISAYLAGRKSQELPVSLSPRRCLSHGKHGTAPSQHCRSRASAQGGCLGVGEALELPGSRAAPSHSRCSYQHRHHVLLVFWAVLCMQVPPTGAGFTQGFNTSR